MPRISVKPSKISTSSKELAPTYVYDLRVFPSLETTSSSFCVSCHCITFRGFKAFAKSAQCWQQKLHQRSICVLFRFLWFCKAAYFPIIATLENPFSISRTRESFTPSTIHLNWGVNPSTRCILNAFLQLSTNVFQSMFPIQLCSQSCGQSHCRLSYTKYGSSIAICKLPIA